VKHLSTEQLSAYLDHALTGRAAEEAERHLPRATPVAKRWRRWRRRTPRCGPALTHDPGEAYFESFPARVEARLRASGLAGAQTRGTGFDLGRFLASPRALAWAGAVAVVVVGAGLALMTGREVRPPDLRDRDLSERGLQVAPGGANAIGEKDRSAQSPPTRSLEKASPASPADVAGREPGGAAQHEGRDARDARGAGGAGRDERAVRAQKDRSARLQARPRPTDSPRRRRCPARRACGQPVPRGRGAAQRGGRRRARAAEARAAPLSDATAPAAEQAGQVRKKSAAEPFKAGAARFLMGGPAKTESTAVLPPSRSRRRRAERGDASRRDDFDHPQALDRRPGRGRGPVCGEVRESRRTSWRALRSP